MQPKGSRCVWYGNYLFRACPSEMFWTGGTNNCNQCSMDVIIIGKWNKMGLIYSDSFFCRDTFEMWMIITFLRNQQWIHWSTCLPILYTLGRVCKSKCFVRLTHAGQECNLSECDVTSCSPLLLVCTRFFFCWNPTTRISACTSVTHGCSLTINPTCCLHSVAYDDFSGLFVYFWFSVTQEFRTTTLQLQTSTLVCVSLELVVCFNGILFCFCSLTSALCVSVCAVMYHLCSGHLTTGIIMYLFALTESIGLLSANFKFGVTYSWTGRSVTVSF